jgi:hypothetical protein
MGDALGVRAVTPHMSAWASCWSKMFGLVSKNYKFCGKSVET